MNTSNKVGLPVFLLERSLCRHKISFVFLTICACGSCVWVNAGAHRGQGQRRAWGRVEGSAVRPTWVFCKSSPKCRVISPAPNFCFVFFFLIAYVRKIDNFVCLFLIQFNTNEGPIKIVKRQYQYIKIYTMDFKNQYCNKTWDNSSGRLGLLRSTQTSSCIIRL